MSIEPAFLSLGLGALLFALWLSETCSRRAIARARGIKSTGI